MTVKTKYKLRARVLRFLDVAGAVVLLVSVAHVAATLKGVDLAVSPRWREVALLGALTVILTWLLSATVFRLVFRFRSLKFALLYPSVSFVTIAVLVLAVWLVPPTVIEKRLLVSSLIVFGVAIVLRGIWAGIREKLSSPPSDQEAVRTDMPNGLEWLGDEKPLGALANDKFGYTGLVKRLAALVAEGSCRSFGLTGPHGSGKSSILQMVETELSKQGNGHIFVYVAGWGREGDGLSKSVLDSIVRQLHDEGVEAHALLTWPVDYMRNVMGDSSYWARALGCCLQDQQGSDKVLARLDPILDAVAKRVVVVVEDVDRNTSSNGMDLLCHLLDDFHAVRNVSFFFLKSEETKTSIDFHRLCEHTERVPEIKPEDLERELVRFIEACKEIAKDKQLLQPERLDLRRIFVTRQVGESAELSDILWPSLSTLAYTPRSLKHALRRVWRIWKSLAGEVDLLELIIWALLREGCPRGYGILKQNLDVLRHLETGSATDDKPKDNTRCFREQIGASEFAPSSDQAFRLALTLLGFKVSVVSEEVLESGLVAVEGSGRTSLPDAVQNVARSKTTDYFRRIEAGELDVGEFSDQKFIRELQQYLNDRSGTLVVKMVEESLWMRKVEQFESFISTDRLVDLIEDNVGVVGRRLTGKANRNSPCVRELWKLWDTRLYRVDKLHGRIETILHRALEDSLELTYALLSMYVRHFDNGTRQRIHTSTVVQLRQKVETNNAYLTSVLNPDEPYALSHMLRHRDDCDVYYQPQDWQWLVSPLCSCMREYPSQTVPDVTDLFVMNRRIGADTREQWLEFDTAYFNGMCATDGERREMASLLLDYADKHNESDRTAEWIRSVRSDLEKYMNPSVPVALT